jgi:hypothetical protein
MRCRIHARPLELIGDTVVFVVTLHRYDDKDPEKIIKRHYLEHDALTNIFNMKGFCQQTAEVLATYPERRFFIVVSDIDSFKTINNMFGDEVGDLTGGKPSLLSCPCYDPVPIEDEADAVGGKEATAFGRAFLELEGRQGRAQEGGTADHLT